MGSSTALRLGEGERRCLPVRRLLAGDRRTARRVRRHDRYRGGCRVRDARSGSVPAVLVRVSCVDRGRRHGRPRRPRNRPCLERTRPGFRRGTRQLGGSAAARLDRHERCRPHAHAEGPGPDLPRGPGPPSHRTAVGTTDRAAAAPPRNGQPSPAKVTPPCQGGRRPPHTPGARPGPAVAPHGGAG